MLLLPPNVLLEFAHQHQQALWDEAKQAAQARELKAAARRPHQRLATFLTGLTPWRKRQPEPQHLENSAACLHAHKQAA